MIKISLRTPLFLLSAEAKISQECDPSLINIDLTNKALKNVDGIFTFFSILVEWVFVCYSFAKTILGHVVLVVFICVAI